MQKKKKVCQMHKCIYGMVAGVMQVILGRELMREKYVLG